MVSSMGEPRPGDFPDPINVRTANVLLKASQTGKAGDYLRFVSKAVGWEHVNTTLITKNGTIGGKGIVQSQQEFASIATNAKSNLAAFGPGSWFYGLAAVALEPNAFVMLARFGTSPIAFGFTNLRSIPTTSGADSTANVILTVPAGHGVRVLDIITLLGWTPTNYDGTFTVTAVTATTITFVNAAVTAASTITGDVTVPVTGEFANAQYIKSSGATFEEGATVAAVCVFSILKGAQGA